MTKLLRDYAYYRTGGECAALYEPATIQELSNVMKDLHRTKMPFFVLGGGTNSLVWDEYYPGAVIIFTKMKSIRLEGNDLICGAGVENTLIAQKALAGSLAGVSWMNRLPGQIGATVRMNARCYGGEISQVVSSVTAVLPDGTIQAYTPADGIFKGYKDTLFMANGAIIAEVTLSLMPGDAQVIADHMQYCEDDRIKKGQFQYPTCGCVFKNSYAVGVPSGMLLDRSEAKSLNKTNVALNPQHSNFVYNKGATSQEILDFTLAMQELVFKEYGVWMEYEMEILGQLKPDLQARVKELRAPQIKSEAIDALKEQFKRNANRMKPET
jgi:UDP-N-acetylmuramate dehydrogenase